MTSTCNLTCQLLALVKCTATYIAHLNAVHQTVAVPSLSVCTCNNDRNMLLLQARTRHTRYRTFSLKRTRKTLINYRLFHTIIDYEKKTISTTLVFTYLGVFC